MIAADSNILLRYVVADEPAQGQAARRLVDAPPGGALFVPREVLVEVVWVLRRVYRLPKSRLADVIETLLRVGTLVFEEAADLSAALDGYRRGAADFPDLMILAAARRADCEALWTFDRRLAREDGVRLLEAEA